MPLLFSVEAHDQDKRIDVFLTERSKVSRAHIQKLIKSGIVLVNKLHCKSNYRIQTVETVLIPEIKTTPAPLPLNHAPLLSVVFENDDLMVINKPAGLLVHPHEGHGGEPTLVDSLLKHDRRIRPVGPDSRRPGIVHRLDKNVSGLMVIAKTPEAFECLKSQFQNRNIYKEYIALVYGSLPKDHEMIEMKIARSKARGRMVARPVSQEGKEAKTEYLVKQRFKNHTLVQVILHTGRTHQIRVHFRAIDHPIVGDTLYKKTHMRRIRPIELDRLFLHAHKLRLRLMDGTEKIFVEPLPEELQSLLKQMEPLKK